MNYEELGPSLETSEAGPPRHLSTRLSEASGATPPTRMTLEERDKGTPLVNPAREGLPFSGLSPARDVMTPTRDLREGTEKDCGEGYGAALLRGAIKRRVKVRTISLRWLATLVSRVTMPRVGLVAEERTWRTVLVA